MGEEGTHAYFGRVIAESGTPIFTRSVDDAIECTNVVMEDLGCKTVAELLQIDAQRLFEASSLISLLLRLIIRIAFDNPTCPRPRKGTRAMSELKACHSENKRNADGEERLESYGPRSKLIGQAVPQIRQAEVLTEADGEPWKIVDWDRTYFLIKFYMP